MKQIYLRYLVLAETLRKSNIDLSGIDDIGKKLLETIAIKSAQGQPLVVPTQVSIDYFEKLGKLMASAIRS